jgi:hypothetical protein
MELDPDRHVESSLSVALGEGSFQSLEKSAGSLSLPQSGL